MTATSSRRSRGGPSSGRLLLAWLLTVAGVVAVLGYPTTTNRAAPWPAAVQAAPTASAEAATAPTGPSTVVPGRTTVSGTFRGDVVPTAVGPVQVEIAVESGTITAVRAVRLPTGDAGAEGATDLGADVGPGTPEAGAAGHTVLDEAVRARGRGLGAGLSVPLVGDGYVASLRSAIDEAFDPSPVATT